MDVFADIIFIFVIFILLKILWEEGSRLLGLLAAELTIFGIGLGYSIGKSNVGSSWFPAVLIVSVVILFILLWTTEVKKN